MTPQIQVLEEVSLVAPLGMRFWDVAAAAPAEDGLAVVAYPDAYPELISTAVWNAAGIYSFSGLPYLRQFENGAGDDAYWSAHPPAVPYTIEVSDPQNRYLPFQLSVLLPNRGLYGLVASPLLPVPVPDATWLPIFSTAARPVGGVTAVIRGSLQDPSGAPAAWAVMTALAPTGAPAIGVTDDRGVISLPLPYPELTSSAFGSPLISAPLKLSDQSWSINIRVFWTPSLTAGTATDLEELLQQSEASVWADTARSSLATAFTLEFGSDLILRSADSVTGRQLSYLLVTAAGSPL